MNIYKLCKDRKVGIEPVFEEQVLHSVRILSDDCQENILMLEEELHYADPELSDLCGLLNDRYEIYALTIPACKSAKLAISIDLKDRSSVLIHGAVSTNGACQKAVHLSTSHRNIINRVWESIR